MSPQAPPKRLPLGTFARCDSERGPIVKVLHYEGEDVKVRSLLRSIVFTTNAARLRAA